MKKTPSSRIDPTKLHPTVDTDGNGGSKGKSADRAMSGMAGRCRRHPDIICFSHLRWDFVFQRPQHLLSRCASRQRVFFIEEPFYEGNILPHLRRSNRGGGLSIVVPKLPEGVYPDAEQRAMLDGLIEDEDIRDYILWYYTPMALSFSRHLNPRAVIYDCMDELSAFKGAPTALGEREAELFRTADIVFTGGQSLYEHKKGCHSNIHPFPSSIDTDHFRAARKPSSEPADQVEIPHPRIGFFGVIDERLDIDLLRELANARPDWHIVMIGPVVKIDPKDLPTNENIHYLGGKKYEELPGYLAGWDVAILPFALNESTRFISPTKTPEYLAAGKPVVSTPIRDVVRPYGEQDLVRIAGTTDEFAQAVEGILGDGKHSAEWLRRVDRFLSGNSWDRTWSKMMELIDGSISARAAMSGRGWETVPASQSVIADSVAA